MVEDDRLWEQYDRSLDEYRFQVDLNWKRSEYFFVLNVAVFVAGVTLLASDKVPRWLNAAVFLAGVLLAVLSVIANHVQAGYYQSARGTKAKLEAALDLGEHALATTQGMGGGVARVGRVRTFLAIMLIAVAAIEVGGAVVALVREHDASGIHAHKTIIKACGRTVTLQGIGDISVSCPR